MTPAPKSLSPSVHAVKLTTTPPLSCASIRDFMSVPVVVFPSELAVNSRATSVYMIRPTPENQTHPACSEPKPISIRSQLEVLLLSLLGLRPAFRWTLSPSVRAPRQHRRFALCNTPSEIAWHISVPSNLSTPHTTYNLVPRRAFSDGLVLEVTKYVVSLGPSNAVGICSRMWPDPISDAGAADVAVSP